MVWGSLDVADYMPSRSPPACNGRIDIDGPALHALGQQQRRVVLSVFTTTDEQRFAATAPDSGDLLTFKKAAILTTSNPNIAKPLVEATAGTPRQKPARHAAPETTSCPLFNVPQATHSELFILLPVRNAQNQDGEENDRYYQKHSHIDYLLYQRS